MAEPIIASKPGSEAPRPDEFQRNFDLLECVACGLCLEVCPTYHLRRDEGSSPRGRIRLMDLLAHRSEDDRRLIGLQSDSDFAVWRRSLDECVGCLACQARCPSGVPFAAMLDRAHARLAAEDKTSWLGGRLLDRVLGSWLADPVRLRRLRLPLRVFNMLRLPELILALRLQRIPGLGFLAGLRWLPRKLPVGPTPPAATPAAPFIFFRGCVGGLFYQAEEDAAMTLLAGRGGYQLRRNTCCGAVHRHLGRLEEACEMARRNIRVCEGSEALIVTQAAGCGAALKEYGQWLADDPEWSERALDFSARVRDLSEVLLAPEQSTAPLAGSLKVCYDDPCHALHAQGLGAATRVLIDALPGVERVELPHCERCCGAGGSYFLRQPEMSGAMIAGKMEDFERSGADLLLTSNPGCRLQWETAFREVGEETEVRHPAELWAEEQRRSRR